MWVRHEGYFGLFASFLSLQLWFVEMSEASDAPALLFSSDQKSLNLEDKLYLEDVANAAEWTQTNSKVEHLSLSLSFDHPDSKAFYGKAAKRLKEALPRLKSIDFNGGYLFDPQQDNVEVFKKEVYDLKHHFDSLADTFNSVGLPVKSVKFSGLQTFEKKTVDDSDFAELFQQVFGAQLSKHEIENHQAEFEYTHSNIKFNVKLSLSITILKKSTGKRDHFYDSVVTINN